MLLHCDLVVADPSARFSLPFVDLGLVPEAASTLLLPRLAGRRRAARYLLLAEPFGAAEALEIGLVSHLAPDGALDDVTSALVAALLAKPTEALRHTQRLLRHGTPRRIAPADGAGEPGVRGAARIGRGQAGDRRIFCGKSATELGGRDPDSLRAATLIVGPGNSSISVGCV